MFSCSSSTAWPEFAGYEIVTLLGDFLRKWCSRRSGPAPCACSIFSRRLQQAPVLVSAQFPPLKCMPRARCQKLAVKQLWEEPRPAARGDVGRMPGLMETRDRDCQDGGWERTASPSTVFLSPVEGKGAVSAGDDSQSFSATISGLSTYVPEEKLTQIPAQTSVSSPSSTYAIK